MINTNLWRRLWRRHALLLFAAAALLSGFQVIMCAVVATLDIGGALAQVLSTLPPSAQALIARDLIGGTSPRGLVAFGWNHPITMIVGAGMGIMLAARAVAGEAESGTIELVLAQPISRATFFRTHLAFGLGALLLATALILGASVAGQAYYKLDVFTPRSAPLLGLSFWLLQACWYAITLAFSTMGREAGRVAAAGFFIAIASYLVQVVGRIWSKAAFLLPYTLHERYAPSAIVVDGQTPTKAMLVLAAVAGAALIVAWLKFRVRDLP